MRHLSLCLTTVFLALLPPALSAADAPKPAPKPKLTTKWDLMDVGPFYSGGLEVPMPGQPAFRPALKGISIKVGTAEKPATMCFDTERLRMAIGWTGGFLDLAKGREGLEGVAHPAGEIVFSSPLLPGWASKDGGFTEEKPPKRDGNEMISFGPLPRDWARWRGLYVNGKQIVLAYTVGRAEVLELPGFDAESGRFTRTLQITGGGEMTLLVCEDAKATGSVEGNVALLSQGGKVVAVGAAGGKGKAVVTLEATPEGRVLAHFPRGANGTYQISVWSGSRIDVPKFAEAVAATGGLPDVKALTKGGPANYNVPLETKGALGREEGAYVVDTITLPEDNPWKSWLRTSGFDFFKDGTTAAICSVSGDVWIVSGIDDKLENLKWKRYATGLFQPLGLKIVDEKVYVLGRDQITRLHDLNKDGEADFYENFNNDVAISSHYHEFCLDLQTDSRGNFYFAKGGNLGGWKHQHHGAFLRVSKDGGKLDVICYGLRAPNGSAVSPAGEMTVSDNEGNWVPSSRVNLIKPGGFYGHVFTSHTETPPTTFDPPMFWLPHDYAVDNSSGGQAWVTSDKWGPFKGDLLHTSYGGSGLFKVMREEVDGVPQAGVWKFPLKFESGIMRARFNARDGQLYLCGLVVWQSNGAKTGAFHRVRYTNKPVNQPREFHIRPNGIEITFTDPLDPATARDDQNYSLEQWNYRWTQNYGSKEYSVEQPEQIKHDSVAIKSVKVSPDHKTVFLEVAGLKPVMQMRLKLAVKGADGTAINQTVWNTINRMPGPVAVSNR